MLKRALVVAILGWLTAAPAFAQKAELGVTIGWVFADGVSGNNFLAPDGNIYNRVDPKDSFGWGIDLGFMVGPNAEVGFLYGNQPSKLVLGGPGTKEVGDMSVNSYHGYFAYNFGEVHGVRPYLLGGFGALDVGDVDYTSVTGASRTVSGGSKFSSTWGAGVKLYGKGHVGGRVGLRWSPAYVKSDAAGYWCDPYWGCYLVGDPQYANQFDINGGVTVRF